MKKYLNKIQSGWQAIVISALIFAPSMVKAVEGLTPKEIERCNAFKAQFKGMFISVPDQFCSANALMLWLIQLLPK